MVKETHFLCIHYFVDMIYHMSSQCTPFLETKKEHMYVYLFGGPILFGGCMMYDRQTLEGK